MSEDYLVRNCAPTLAGLKTANLFTCPIESREATMESIRSLNRHLSSKGLRIIPLRFSEQSALIYLYRPQKLSEDLRHSIAVKLLQEQGYETGNCEKCLVQLRHRLHQQADFPHEIGLFLGYPPEDVCGFIHHHACQCKCVGCWKVYGDVDAAQKKFAQYKKCTRVYCSQWAKGQSIQRLAVSTPAHNGCQS